MWRNLLPPPDPLPARAMRWEWGMAVGLIGCFALAYIALAGHRDTLLNSDFFSFARRMDQLGKVSWRETWVNGLYPIGYPYLIKGLSAFTGSYVSAAHGVSVFSGVVGLCALWLLARRLAIWPLAFCTVLLTGCNHWYLTFATSEGTDMPAVAIILSGLVLAATPHPSQMRLLGLGAVLGLGYLIRYTTLLALPALALAWLASDPRAWRRTAADMAWVIAAFALCSAPQWIASLLVKGSPFYNTQHWNIWFAIAGNGKWARILTEGSRYANLGQVIQAVGFPAFLKNFVLNILRLLLYDQFLYPAHLLSLAGAAIALFYRTRISMLVLVTALVYGAAISMAFLSTRVLLLLIPFQILLSLWPLAVFRGKYPRIIVHEVFPALLILSLGYASYWYDVTWTITNTQYSQVQKELPVLLRKAGMSDVSQVVSFSYNLYDVSSPNAARYATPWQGDPVPIRSEPEVIWLAVHGGYKYVLTDLFTNADIPDFDKWYGPGNHFPALRQLFKSPEAEAYAVPDSLARSFRTAGQSDWEEFAHESAPTLLSIWQAQMPYLQERASLPAKPNEVTPQLLSAWRRYKGLHHLL